MIFWILAALLTCAVTLAVVTPFLRARRQAHAAPSAHDVEVYRDQLAELERDAAAGLIPAAEAETARAEIGRRLLKAAGSGRAGRSRKALSPALALASLALIAAVPVIAFGGYLVSGNPGMPGQPLAARQDDIGPGTDLAVLVRRAEEHLSANPQDGRGWDVLAPIYLRLGRLDDAETAYRNAMRYLGPSADRQIGLGQALMAQAGGVVTQEAKVAFEAARMLDVEDPRPAFYLALALSQDGKRRQARKAWQSVIDSAPEGAPWLPAAKRQLAALDEPPAATEPAPGKVASAGPDEEQIAAAMAMAPAERSAMIRGMVDSLDQELRENPDDPEGWARLIRSYVVLGEPESASDALERALGEFPAETEEGATLIQLARNLGVATENNGP